MNRVCRLVQCVRVDESFNLSPQHVDSEHKPPPPRPPTRLLVGTKSADTNRVKGGDAKSPPHAPVEQADGAPDETASDANSDRDQVSLTIWDTPGLYLTF